jgi:hypothetical protein
MRLVLPSPSLLNSILKLLGSRGFSPSDGLLQIRTAAKAQRCFSRAFAQATQASPSDETHAQQNLI